MAGPAETAARDYVAKRKKKVLSPSQAAKEARAGKDMGKPGKGFQKIVQSGIARGLSAEDAQREAGAVFQRMRRAGKL